MNIRSVGGSIDRRTFLGELGELLDRLDPLLAL